MLDKWMALKVMLALWIMTLFAPEAGAQRAGEFPTKPVRWLVGFAPGGGSSILSRLVAQKLSDRWGVSVVVDNRPGAAGATSLHIAAASAPDGHTVVVLTSSMVVSAEVFSRQRQAVLDRFRGISQMSAQPYVLLVTGALPAHSVDELVALAKTRGGALNYGSSGNGTLEHLAMELFKGMTQVRMNHIPYKGAGQTLIDLLGGHINVALSSAISASPHIKGGRLRAIGVTGSSRLAGFPDLPTLAEAGLRGYEVTAWYGLLAPRAAPEAVVQKFNTELRNVLDMPDVRATLAGAGALAAPGTAQAFEARIIGESRKWTQVVRQAGIATE
jgi:tripartite-type tricarboxylate transporter receptor subunit TctC